MNLADAIRQAALSSGVSLTETQSRTPITVIENTEPIAAPDPPIPVPTGANTTAVRLELFVSPEQLQYLFRSVVMSQHSVMTLREAANFLRIHAAVLEQLALDRQVPAVQVDGKWRFSRPSLEEWLKTSTEKRGEA